MGFPIIFNWVLQIEPPAALKLNGIYNFEKSNNRVFPLDMPIDLIDPQRIAIAKISIKSFTNERGGSTGVFEVLKIYTDAEKKTLSNYWMENQ